ncbi:hypothetical protein EJB05_41243, partial [Eragrostis curvula]
MAAQLELRRRELRRIRDSMRMQQTRWGLAMALTVGFLRSLVGSCMMYVYAVKLKEDLAVKFSKNAGSHIRFCHFHVENFGNLDCCMQRTSVILQSKAARHNLKELDHCVKWNSRLLMSEESAME